MSYSKKLNALREEVVTAISKRAEKEFINTERDYKKLCFNLPRGAYLFCITPKNLVDNYGYTHYYSALPLEELCEIADTVCK